MILTSTLKQRSKGWWKTSMQGLNHPSDLDPPTSDQFIFVNTKHGNTNYKHLVDVKTQAMAWHNARLWLKMHTNSPSICVGCSVHSYFRISRPANSIGSEWEKFDECALTNWRDPTRCEGEFKSLWRKYDAEIRVREE